jgi:hypothetical protein
MGLVVGDGDSITTARLAEQIQSGFVPASRQSMTKSVGCVILTNNYVLTISICSDEIGIVQPSGRGVAVQGDTDQEPRTIHPVPTLLNDEIRLGDTDRKVSMVQLER